MSHNTIIFIYTFTVIIFPAVYVSCIISYRNKASYKSSFKLLKIKENLVNINN